MYSRLCYRKQNDSKIYLRLCYNKTKWQSNILEILLEKTKRQVYVPADVVIGSVKTFEILQHRHGLRQKWDFVVGDIENGERGETLAPSIIQCLESGKNRSGYNNCDTA